MLTEANLEMEITTAAWSALQMLEALQAHDTKRTSASEGLRASHEIPGEPKEAHRP